MAISKIIEARLFTTEEKPLITFIFNKIENENINIVIFQLFRLIL